jgi:hypothetical protein
MKFVLFLAVVGSLAEAFGPGGPKAVVRRGATALKVRPN